MTENQRQRSEAESKEQATKLYHPLLLQGLPPDRFTAKVNEILSGRISLLTRRL